MGDGKHCPGCEKDIGVWPVLMAGLPTWVRCPHCRARLSYGNSGLVMAVLSAFFLLLILGGIIVLATLAYFGERKGWDSFFPPDEHHHHH